MFKKITKHINNNYYVYCLIGICLIALVLFFPSLTNFYTNDDFFHLRISQVSSVKDFFNFFNLMKSPEGWGLYRPLTTQIYYFISSRLFNLNPLPLHVISFITFFGIIFLVAELTMILTKNTNIALLSAILYATSATHFGHLYFLGAYQELGMTLFFLLSVIYFIKFELLKKYKYLIISLLCFVLALMSKETAVVLPFIMVLIHIYLKFKKEKAYDLKHFLAVLIAFLMLLLIYLYMRFKYYGFAQGDSYLWDFSIKKVLNSIVWYKLWSLNIPETLVDFVGPGLKLNQNLFKYWGREFTLIFSLFAAEVLILFVLVINKFKDILKDWKIYVFSIFWFIFTLVPVLFLPVHKFTYYLTLPIIGIVICISSLLTNFKFKKIIFIFMIIWISNSFITLKLTRNTNWITQGAKTSKNVFKYFEKNKDKFLNKEIIFYDTKDDKNLPFSPTLIVKTSLSDKNFFEVFFKDIKNVFYLTSEDKVGNVESRQFIGY
jgi:hypothetical protein